MEEEQYVLLMICSSKTQRGVWGEYRRWKMKKWMDRKFSLEAKMKTLLFYWVSLLWD